MIPDWETNKVYFSKLLKEKYPDVFNEIGDKLKVYNYTPEILPLTNDIWARDYMPVQINANTFIEYRFDPDYLQGGTKGYRDLKTYPDMVCDAINLKTRKSGLILDGGNLVKSSDCIILADKVIKENRLSYNRTDLIKKLQETFEVEKVVLIPWDKSEKYGHADGMVRFIDNETVVMQYYFKGFAAMIKPLQEAGLIIEYIDYTVKKNDNRNWAYLNFLQTKDFMLLPKFGIEEDKQASEQIESFYLGYKGKIVQIDMTEIVKFGGTLNCISWTTKE